MRGNSIVGMGRGVLAEADSNNDFEAAAPCKHSLIDVPDYLRRNLKSPARRKFENEFREDNRWGLQRSHKNPPYRAKPKEMTNNSAVSLQNRVNANSHLPPGFVKAPKVFFPSIPTAVAVRPSEGPNHLIDFQSAPSATNALVEGCGVNESGDSAKCRSRHPSK